MTNRVAILGAGALGIQFKHFIANYSENTIEGWFDDTKKIGEVIAGLKVNGGLDDISLNGPYDEIAIAIGYKHLPFKNELIKKLIAKGIRIFTFKHPSAYIDCSACISSGTFIYPNATIDQKVKIGNGCIINNNVVISHDSEISSSSFLAPSVTISGNVKIGENCFIGAGTIINDSIKICNNVILGSGSHVVKDINEPGTYVGGPKLRKLSNENPFQ